MAKEVFLTMYEMEIVRELAVSRGYIKLVFPNRYGNEGPVRNDSDFVTSTIKSLLRKKCLRVDDVWMHYRRGFSRHYVLSKRGLYLYAKTLMREKLR